MLPVYKLLDRDVVCTETGIAGKVAGFIMHSDGREEVMVTPSGKPGEAWSEPRWVDRSNIRLMPEVASA